MAYEKQTWVNNETVIDKDKMDHIEDGVYNNDASISQINTSLSDLDARVTALEQAAGITSKESPQSTEPGPEEDPNPDDGGDDGDGTAKEEPGIVIPDDGDPDEGDPDDGGDDGDTKTAPGPEETGDGDEPDDGDDGDTKTAPGPEDTGDDTPAPDPEETE